MPYPKMPKTGRFLSGRFCQISIRILDPAFENQNFYPVLDRAYKTAIFQKIGTKRVDFGLVGPPRYSLDICTSGKVEYT